VAYIGDDLGDLPAFDALDRLADRGIAAVKVAVRTPDVSAALTQRAHVLVDGPDGALELLRSIG
jgi:trehalose 6-phosphate phosphatase